MNYLFDMKLKLLAAFMLLSLPVFGQKKYALWNKPTKLHISLPVDSFKLVQRKQYSYYLAYCKGYEVSMFVKPEKVVTGYLKKRI